MLNKFKFYQYDEKEIQKSIYAKSMEITIMMLYSLLTITFRDNNP